MHFGLVALLVVCTISNATAAETRGRVVRVLDGDTFIMQADDNRRVTIRLQGVDAPERTMPYSQISRRHLGEMVMDKIVTFNPEKLDRHGRTVAVVRLQDGTDVCLAQIRTGLAWHFKRYENEQSAEDRAAYAAAELIARAARRGLWRDPEPLPPWEFRAVKSAGPETP